MKKSPVHHALAKLVSHLDADNIPYAIVGAMALNAYGYHRVTTDVDVLMTRESLERFKRAHLGFGYVEKFPGSKSLRDTEFDVGIDVLIVGDYPGDGKPKSVSFPDPARAAVKTPDGTMSSLPVSTIIELKLVSGTTTTHRLKDLADVQELIKATGLSRELGDTIDPSVRAKYFELWDGAQGQATDVHEQGESD